MDNNSFTMSTKFEMRMQYVLEIAAHTHDVLYAFNKKKLQNFIKTKENAFLLSHFV